VRYQRGFRPNADLERLIGANSRTPSWCSATSAASSAPTGWASGASAELAGKLGREKILAGFARLLELSEATVKAAIAECRMGSSRPSASSTTMASTWKCRCASTCWWKRPATDCISISAARPSKPKGPANIRPPLVQAACTYALISLIDPSMYVSSGLGAASP